MPTRKVWLALVAAIGLGLSACESLSPMSGPNVAERDPDNPQTASANISSLSDVISRRPNDPVAYNQRGIAYARNGELPGRDRRFLARHQAEPEIRRGLHQSRAGLSPDREGRSRARRPQQRHRRQPELCPGLSRARQSPARPRAISTTRWPT